MKDEKQFKQMMMQYNQLKNGAIDIKHLIDIEDYDSAITMMGSRQPIYLNCKCMRKFLELTPEQEKELNEILDELRALELENIHILEKNMAEVKEELQKSQKTKKIHHAYNMASDDSNGTIVNIEE